MRPRILLRTQLARVGACLALLNFAVPGGALVSFGVPAKAAVGKLLADRAKAAKDLAARRARSASRLLTDDEQGKMQGKTGENPYLAGGSKWDVVYKGVDLMTGNYSTSATDLSFDGGYGIPVNVTRSYSANQADEGPFGKGWTLSADVRSTAGGLLKSGSAPVRSIPLNLKERSDAEADPNVAVQPAQAVTAVDAGGTEETVQKDVDGVLTTPAWDKNVYDSQYEWVTLNGQQYQVLVSNTVKTPEGTVYTYAKEGTYPNGTYAWNDPNQVAQAANVLKVTSATDRQGNVTTYSYGSGTVTFSHSNGTTVEHPLIGVSMPGGHAITLTWGQNASAASYMRLTSVSDGPRTVGYTYTGQPGHGLLASATSAGGKTTQYGYGISTAGYVPSNDGPTSGTYSGPLADGLLTAITDPRGLTTTIAYKMVTTAVLPSYSMQTRPFASRVVQPNGMALSCFVSPLVNNDNYPNYPNDPYNTILDFCFEEATPGANGTVTNQAIYEGGAWDSGSVYLSSVLLGAPAYSPFENYFWLKTYSTASEDLLQETNLKYASKTRPLWAHARLTHDGATNTNYEPILAADRVLDRQSLSATPYGIQNVVTTKSYNFMGQPLASTTKETDFPTGQTTHAVTMGYAYWGADKYWQQKATRDPAGRIAVTDYYPSTALAGRRGQTYRVYDPKYGGTGVDTSLPVPSYAAPGTEWRYRVTFAPDQYAAEFQYDPQGRPTLVKKLQSATTSPWTYVQTKTTYGADGPNGTWGQASQVVEDYGDASHVNRTTTTAHYTPWGKACDVVDAAGHEFVTDFDPDGQVNGVTRTDVSPHQAIVSYAYGSSGVENGQPTQVTDGLSGVTQSIAYCQSGGGIGMPASVTETNGSDAYTTSYAYDAAGDRQTATYATSSGTTRWSYLDYLSVGSGESASRPFQTLCRLDAGGRRTAEEMHYSYGSTGQIQEAAFAQSPALVSGQPYVPASGAPYYDKDHLPASRARTHYEYDAAGRLTLLAHYWDTFDGNGAHSKAILANACDYELSGSNRGLKTASRFYSQSSSDATQFALDRTETYGYDAQLDQLTSASYGDGNPNASPTWGYDAAGNRGDAVTDSLNRATSLGGVSVTNDILGNRIAKGGTTYGWDCLNRMTSLSGAITASYQYRADGMRVSKQTGGVNTLYRYSGQMGIEDVETTATGASTVTRYSLGTRGVEMIERTNSSGTVTAFPIYDAHGNNVASLTRSGTGFAIGDRRTYDAWGVVRAQQSGGDPKLRYCASLGHKADDESGLIYMRSRYYEPASGRFASADPAYQGGNWFAYCANNPVNAEDGSGEWLSGLKSIKDLYDCWQAYMAFGSAMHAAKDSGDVESAWGQFMQVWSSGYIGSDQSVANEGVRLSPMQAYKGIKNYLETLASSGADAASQAVARAYLNSACVSTITDGFYIGAKLCLLGLAYNQREAWYVNDIDNF